MQQCDFESDATSIVNESEGIIVPTANPDFKYLKKLSLKDKSQSPTTTGKAKSLLKHLPVSPQSRGKNFNKNQDLGIVKLLGLNINTSNINTFRPK